MSSPKSRRLEVSTLEAVLNACWERAEDGLLELVCSIVAAAATVDMFPVSKQANLDLPTIVWSRVGRSAKHRQTASALLAVAPRPRPTHDANDYFA